IVGNIDHKWTEVMRPVPNIVIPFFAFGLGTGIDISAVLTGGLTGIVLGLLVTPITGGTTYLAYRFLLRRGPRSGIGFAAGTTAGNSIVTPAIIASADPRFEQYVDVATVQVATAVLISAVTAPLIAAWFLKRNGALSNPEELEDTDAASVPAASTPSHLEAGADAAVNPKTLEGRHRTCSMLSLPVHGSASGSAPARGAEPLGTSRGTDRWAPPARRPELRRRAPAPSRLVPRFLLPRFSLTKR